jgi:histidinol-phosphatase
MDTPPVDRELLDFAVGVADRAGQLALERFFAGADDVRTKPDRSEVTDADLAVEEQIRAELRDRLPDDDIYGEEAGFGGEGGNAARKSARRWVIDPIDGTAGFVRRIPLFRTMLAYEDEHGPAIGVINQPTARQIVFAGRGRGCWRVTGTPAATTDATRTWVSDRNQFDPAPVGMGDPGRLPEELLLALHRRVFLYAPGGPIGLVTGQLDAYLVPGHLGEDDLAPLPVIVREAGGRVTDLAGAPLHTGDGSVLATNGLLHDKFLDLVAGLPRTRR